MEILLARHGNTFGPHDPVVWAGSSNDLPLVEKGVQQAERLARTLISQRVQLSGVYCSPLQRTSKYAQIISDALQLSEKPHVDLRINEIDYGDWTGLTQEEVVAKFGESALHDWETRSLWPKNGRWGSTESQIIADVSSFVRDLTQKFQSDQKVLVVTSNGRLRYFLKLIAGEFEKRVMEKNFKVKTGNISKIIYSDTKKIVSYWNIEPQDHIAL